jgi:hypothetical protein
MFVDIKQFQFCTTRNEFGSSNINKHERTHTHTYIDICKIFCMGQFVLFGFPRCSTPSGMKNICVSVCVCMTRQRTIAVLFFTDVEFPFDGGGRHLKVLVTV